MDPKGIGLCIVLYLISRFILGLYTTIGIFIIHTVFIPMLFKHSDVFRRSLIFANFVQWPFGVALEHPETCGIEGARNFKINYFSKVDNCPISIGVWHILPMVYLLTEARERLNSTSSKAERDRYFEEKLLESDFSCILYCHGNSHSRAAVHRVQLYKLFQQMNIHTIAFDYRGYGDSTNVRPSELGVVEDTLMVYNWLIESITKNGNREPPSVFVWGHSLGTGISAHLLGNLPELSKSLLERRDSLPLPQGLVLESPFSNMADEVRYHVLSKLVSWIPYYSSSFVEPFATSTVYSFKSDQYLSRQTSLPILILHAKDDLIVPFTIGVKLYESIERSRQAGGAAVVVHSFDHSERLGHRRIYCSHMLLYVLAGFFSDHDISQRRGQTLNA